MAQLPGGNHRAASVSAPSPSPAPSNAASPAGQNGGHANQARGGMSLPGAHPYQTNMGPPLAGMRRPSVGGQGSGAMSPQQKPIPFPYGASSPTTSGGGGGGGEAALQYSGAGAYNQQQLQQQQWNNNYNASNPSANVWASSPSTAYSGYSYPGTAPQNTANGSTASSSTSRPAQSTAATPEPGWQNAAASPATGANSGGAFAETSSISAPSPGVHFQQQQQQVSGRDDPQDAKQVMDVLGGSGIDLRAEEEAMRARDIQQRAGLPSDYNSSQSMPSGFNGPAYSVGGSSNSQPPLSSLPFLQLYPLASFVHAIASTHGLGVEPDVLSTLSTAARLRFRNLLENMIASSRQRCWTTHDRPPPLHEGADDEAGSPTRKKRKPMYHQELISDPSKWLTAIEKADRGEEVKARRRRAQRQREAMLAAAAAESAAQGGNAASGVTGVDGEGDEAMGPDGGGPATPGGEGLSVKKKGRPLSAKNISEDVRRRLANNTAARALGGSTTPKWMMMGTGSSPSSGFSTPTRTKGESGADVNGENQTPAFGSVGGGLSSLPKPRFGPAVGIANTSSSTNGGSPWARSLAPSGLAGTPLRSAGDGTSGEVLAGKVNPHGWGDLTQRALAKEEEERRRRKRVNLQDVYHAVETERRSGVGRGGGEKSIWKWRNLGPEIAKKSASSSATTGTSGSASGGSGSGGGTGSGR